MHKIIIIDDEAQAVANLIEAIDWLALEIGTVLYAYSMEQAIRVFNENGDIGLMICDIEMPKGSGIDLLRWVRANHPDVENIFLTCHADFHFAREALSLGTMDYLLKPVPFDELAETIGKAIGRIKEKRNTDEKSLYGTYWLENRSRIEEQFWQEVLTGKIDSSEENLESILCRRRIELDMEQSYFPMLIEMRDIPEEKRNRLSFRDMGLNALREIVSLHFGHNIKRIVQIDDTYIILLLNSDFPESYEGNDLRMECRDMISRCDQALGLPVNIYLGTAVSLKGLPGMYQKLADMAVNNVVADGEVLMLASRRNRKPVYERPCLEVWHELICQGKEKSLAGEIDSYLERMVLAGKMDSSVLKEFCQEFLQLLYRVLSEKKIPVGAVLSTGEIEEYYEESSKSVTKALLMIRRAGGAVISYLSEQNEDLSLVEKVKSYVSRNLSNEITRDCLVGQISFNPDYMTRVFKRETGETISEYIYREKMKFAENLLLHTDLSIADVAGKIGYSNFSHFSKMFRRYSGMNPNEYRHSKKSE